MGKIIEEGDMKVIINRDEKPMYVRCIRGNERVVINLVRSNVVETNVTSGQTVTIAQRLVEKHYLKLFAEWNRLNP